MQPLTASALICCLSLAAGHAIAGGPVRVATVSGQTIEGTWEGFSKDKLTVVVDGKSAELGIPDLMSVHMVASMSAPAPASRPADTVVVHLADGSRFDATIAGTGGEELELRTDLVSSLNVRLSNVAGIQFKPATGLAEAFQAFTNALEHRDATQDTLFVIQENKVSPLRGQLVSLGAGGGTFKWRERTVKIDRSRAFGIVLARGAGVPTACPVLCTTTDGAVWAGAPAGGDEQSISLQLGAGPQVAIPLSRITDLRFRNARVTFLSDIEPSKYEFTPWGVTRWPYRRDRSVADQRMSIGGESFDRGIGMHSQSVLTYTLTEPFQQFAATIGMDDAVGARGNVAFRVTADGREVYNSGPVKGGGPGKPIAVAIKGAKVLQLLVDFGDDLDVADHADWGAARLIR